MLFCRFISENLTVYLNRLEHEEGDHSFCILLSELFGNVRPTAGFNQDLNETLQQTLPELLGQKITNRPRTLRLGQRHDEAMQLPLQ